MCLCAYAGHLFRYLANQPPKANSTFHPSGVGKSVPALAGKAKAGMLHSVSGWSWTRGVQVKLWYPSRSRAIPECLRGVFTTRRYTNTHLPLPLPRCHLCLLLTVLWLRFILFCVQLEDYFRKLKNPELKVCVLCCCWRSPLFVVILLLVHCWCFTMLHNDSDELCVVASWQTANDDRLAPRKLRWNGSVSYTHLTLPTNREV